MVRTTAPRLRRAASSAVAVALTVTAAGCGKDRSLTVVAPRPVEREALARYPPGTPERSTLELLRAVQLNDPATAVRYVAPAVGLSRAEVVRSLDDLRRRALTLRVPPRLTVADGSPAATSVLAQVGRDRMTLRWARTGAGWRLTGIGARSRSLTKAITDYLFFAHHPQLREIKPGDEALLREWYAIWTRVRRIGR